jgi:hypothetical protein
MVVLGASIPVYPQACLFVLGLAFLCVPVNDLSTGIVLIVLCLGVFTDGWNNNRSVDDVAYRLNVAHIYVTEIVVYTLAVAQLVQRLLRPSNTRDKETNALDRLLPFFALATIWAMFYGYERTKELQKAFGYHGGRVILVSIVFYFLIVNTLTGTTAATRLLKWFFLAATLKATYALVAYMGGYGGVQNTYNGMPVPIYEIEESFALGVCITGAVAGIVFDVLTRRETVFALGASSVMLLDIVLSLRRSVWVSLVVSFAVIFFLSPAVHKLRIVVCGLLFSLALLTMGPDVSERLQQRIGFLANFVQRPELIAREDGDVQFHYYDILDSWAAFKQTPFGRGFPGEYTRVMTSNDNNEVERYLGTGIVHNELLNIAVKMGVFGIVLYLLLLAGFTRDVYFSLPLADGQSKAILATCLGAILGGAALGLTSAHLIGNTKYPMVYFMLLALGMVVRAQLVTRHKGIAMANEGTVP